MGRNPSFWHPHPPAPCHTGGARGLTLIEVLILLALLAVTAWMLIPRRDPLRRHGQRLVCMAKLHELHKGTLAYAAASDGYFPLAWHVGGPSVADDLSNLAYSRFAIHEQCDPTFRRAVTPGDVEASVGFLPARQQKYRQTALFWKCPTKGWTDDYFAPETLFPRSGRPPRQADLAAQVPPAERPLFADVNASFPDPQAEDFQNPGHHAELRNGFSIVSESRMEVFLGVGSSLRAEGVLSSGRFDFRHGDAANVVFLDGHADFVAPADQKRLEALHKAWGPPAGDPGAK